MTEILVYIAVLAIIIVVVSSFFLWISQSNTKARALREVSDNLERAIQTITLEIKEASSLYPPTSAFDSHPGQLSLKTKKYLPDGEALSYLDFFLCGTQLCLKKESQIPITLTTDRVEVSNLVFSPVITSDTPSVQINLKINYKTPAEKPAYQASLEAITTVSLRSY